jgi:hypothetical protein
VNPLLALVAVAVVGGGVVAVSARDARVALLGLVVALIASPLLADPTPALLPLAARLVSAILAAELVWITLRATTTRTRGSALGWPVEVLVATAAFLVGVGMAGLGVETAGPREAQAAGIALGVLALNPVLFGRDTFRLGVGLVLLVVAAIVLRVALAGTPGALEQLITGGMVVALGGALAVLCANAFQAGGEFELPERRRPSVSTPGGTTG